MEVAWLSLMKPTALTDDDIPKAPFISWKFEELP